VTTVVRRSPNRCVTLSDITCAVLKRVHPARSTAIMLLAREWDAAHPAEARTRERAFADAVVAARKARGWSQRGLADALGLARSTVASWERADMVPGDETALAAARALCVPPASFLEALVRARRGS
jgi:ribosome-binding protein aMBF1 (putative translation factor)